MAVRPAAIRIVIFAASSSLESGLKEHLNSAKPILF